MKTFPLGGVHPSDNKKWSNAKTIEVLELPDVVNIPLGQHIGAPATAKVAKGDKVLTGQLIAEATGFMYNYCMKQIDILLIFHFHLSIFNSKSSEGTTVPRQAVKREARNPCNKDYTIIRVPKVRQKKIFLEP